MFNNYVFFKLVYKEHGMVKESISDTTPIYVMLLKNDNNHYVRIDRESQSIIGDPNLVKIAQPLIDEYKRKLQMQTGNASIAIFELGLSPKICKTTLKDLKKRIQLPAAMTQFTGSNMYGVLCDCDSLYNSDKCFSPAKKIFRIKEKRSKTKK